jgi:uncharacterized protein RhaS with RHS repeats
VPRSEGLGARDYDPVVGRWTSKDPILFDGGQANLYVYAGNDPINRLDPSGLIAGVDDLIEAGGSLGPLLPAAAAGVGLYCLLNPDVCGAVIHKVSNWIKDACKPEPTIPEICPYVRQDETQCFYICKRTREIAIRRRQPHPLTDEYPDNDNGGCPKSISAPPY